MGAETVETMTLPMDQDSAKALILNAIGDMKKYKLVDEDESLGLVRWRKGFGWTRWSRPWLYDTLKLFNGYRVRRPGPKVAPAR